MGNKADLSSNDCSSAEDDDAIGRSCSLECSHGRRLRVARRSVAQADRGRRAAAASRPLRGRLAHRRWPPGCGGRRAFGRSADPLRHADELFDATALLANQPLPVGARVGVITNAGGHPLRRRLRGERLTLPPLTPRRRRACGAFAEASVGNLVDMLASGSPASYGQALKLVLPTPASTPRSAVHPAAGHPGRDVAAALTAAAPKPDSRSDLLRRIQVLPALGQAAIPRTPPRWRARAGHAARRAVAAPPGRPGAAFSTSTRAARAVVAPALGREESIPLFRRGRGAAGAYGILTATGVAACPRSGRAGGAHAGRSRSSSSRDGLAWRATSAACTRRADAPGSRRRVPRDQRAGRARLDGAMDGAPCSRRGGVECLVGVVTDPTSPLIGFGSAACWPRRSAIAFRFTC